MTIQLREEATLAALMEAYLLYDREAREARQFRGTHLTLAQHREWYQVGCGLRRLLRETGWAYHEKSGTAFFLADDTLQLRSRRVPLTATAGAALYREEKEEEKLHPPLWATGNLRPEDRVGVEFEVSNLTFAQADELLKDLQALAEQAKWTVSGGVQRDWDANLREGIPPPEVAKQVKGAVVSRANPDDEDEELPEVDPEDVVVGRVVSKTEVKPTGSIASARKSTGTYTPRPRVDSKPLTLADLGLD